MYQRPRRNRRSEAIRSAVRETRLHPSQLVVPLFLTDGENHRQVIPSLSVAYRMSVDETEKEIAACLALGLDKFIIFPAVDDQLKDKVATYSYAEDNFYLKAVRRLKERYPEACFISDVAMDPYSSDGHDGYV